jgi:Protein of unknown function (DUF4013)
MTSAGDGFAWPFRDPDWPAKMLVQGLIALIPIIGWISLAGWLLMTVDGYRGGRRELPQPGFHLERGAPLFLVYLVYALVFSIPGAILQGSGHTQANPGIETLGNLLDALLGLALVFLAPAIIVHTYRSGFNGGFDITGIWQTATANSSTTVVAAVVIFAAGVISVFGFACCCVGAIFTIPYGAAITAGAIAWYDRTA